MNISEELNILNIAKQDIKSAIIEKGQTVGDNMHEYADAIKNISGGGEDTNDYLCFEAVEDSAISLSNYGGNAPNIEYSFDKKSWTTWDYSNIDMPAGSKIYFRGNNPNGFNHPSNVYSNYVMSGLIKASGCLNSLLKIKDFDSILDFTPYGAWVFGQLFSNCTALISAPSVPAITLTERCYAGTFKNTSITETPYLPFTTVGLSSCGSMFSACAQLEKTQDILFPTTLANYCFQWMYNGCVKLKKAPYLPATTLALGSYDYMFGGCSSLQYIKAEFLSIATGTGYMVQNITTSGVFIKNKDASWTTKGNNSCPSSWTLIKSAS